MEPEPFTWLTAALPKGEYGEPLGLLEFRGDGAMRRTDWALAAVGVVVVVVAAKKAKKAVAVYVEEVAAGAKPIEGVGTAVATFVGLGPD
jgi:hypothetical protein